MAQSAEAERGDSTYERTDPKYDYETEPRRIRKGSSWARKLFKKLGIMSARERRISKDE